MMKFPLRPRKKSKGDLIAGVLSVAIIIASTIIVVNTITPIIQQGQTLQSFNDAKQVLTDIDSAINEIMLEAPGSKRSLSFNLQKGRLIVAGAEDRIKLRIENVDLLEAGVTVEESNILITGGASIDSYEQDVDTDGDTDLVLENAAVLFAAEKKGLSSSWTSINTTTIISRIKNVRTGVNITPVSGIFINDLDNSSYGTGYSELAAPTTADSRAIRIFVNASSGMQYEAIFTLQAAKDFVDLQVKRIV